MPTVTARISETVDAAGRRRSASSCATRWRLVAGRGSRRRGDHDPDHRRRRSAPGTSYHLPESPGRDGRQGPGRQRLAADDSGRSRTAPAGGLPVLALGRVDAVPRTPASADGRRRSSSACKFPVRRRPATSRASASTRAPATRARTSAPVDGERHAAGQRHLHGRDGDRLAAGDLLARRWRSPPTRPTSPPTTPPRAATRSTATTSRARYDNRRRCAPARTAPRRQRPVPLRAGERLPDQQLPGDQLLGRRRLRTRPDGHAAAVGAGSTPAPGATDVAVDAVVTARSARRWTLHGDDGQLRAARLLGRARAGRGRGERRHTTLTPHSPLSAGQSYTADAGGATRKDLAGNALAADDSGRSAHARRRAVPARSGRVRRAEHARERRRSADELGVNFRSTAAGYITGVRFYKGAGNTGTHSGTCGPRPASCSPAPPSPARGDRLAAGVLLDAGGDHGQHDLRGVLLRPRGPLRADRAYFASAVNSPPLSALADGAGGNGVYRVGARAASRAAATRRATTGSTSSSKQTGDTQAVRLRRERQCACRRPSRCFKPDVDRELRTQRLTRSTSLQTQVWRVAKARN